MRMNIIQDCFIVVMNLDLRLKEIKVIVDMDLVKIIGLRKITNF